MEEVRQTTVLDTGLQHLGTVYAKALLGASEKAGNTETVMAELDSVVRDVLTRLPRLEQLLSSPRVPFESKEQVLERAFGGKMSSQVLNFLKVIVARGRFQSLRAVNEAAKRLYNELRGRVEVQVTTATPIDDATREMLVAKLRSSLGRDIDLQMRLEPDVIGGLVIRIGDTVYDGSVANQLQKLGDELVSRATQRMRADGDRFAIAN